MSPPRSVPQMRLALGNRVVTSLFIAGAFVCLVSCSDRGSLIAPENARTAALFQVTEGQSQAAAGAGTRLGQYRRIWPHEDGRGWAYHLTSRTWDQPPPVLFPTRGDVPTISMDDAIRLLGTEPTGANPETSTGSYRLQFSGSVTTLSGVSRQNLQETLEQGAAAPGISNTASFAAAHAGSAFLDLLRRARPVIEKFVTVY